jgi:hypothetical protein
MPKPINPSELSRSIYKPKEGMPQESLAGDSREALAFTIMGYEVPEKDPKAYCKIVRVNDTISYWVLRGPNGKLFNPYGLYEETEIIKRRTAAQKPFVMRETTEKMFRHYLQFLKSKNPAWLINAEREGI